MRLIVNELNHHVLALGYDKPQQHPNIVRLYNVYLAERLRQYEVWVRLSAFTRFFFLFSLGTVLSLSTHILMVVFFAATDDHGVRTYGPR